MLRVEGLSFAYGDREVLTDLAFKLAPGELVALLGINGSGKSTLLKNLNGILKPNRGTVLVDGMSITGLSPRDLAKAVGYMPQQSNGVAATVFDAVLLGRKPHIRFEVSDHDLKVVADTLRLLGLTDYALRSTEKLSGGELQKVIIARALAQEPEILLLDEPISHLDIRNQIETMSLLRRISRDMDLVVVVVLHDLSMAARFADRFIMLKSGHIHAEGDLHVITPDTIRNVYGIEATVHTIDGVPTVIPLAPGASPPT